MKHVDIVLQRWQVAYATEEAQRRTANARKNAHRDGTTSAAGLEASTADLVGALCELALSVYLDVADRFFEEYVRNGPDVGFVEVRGSLKRPEKKLHDLRVYREDQDNAPIMVAATVLEHSDQGAIVRLQGWADSEQAWNYSKPAPFPPHPKKGQARYYREEYLHPMTTLRKHHQLMEAW